jgi:hypothetical protein
MRALKGVVPVAVSVGLIMAVTAILWQLRLAANSSPTSSIFIFFR